MPTPLNLVRLAIHVLTLVAIQPLLAKSTFLAALSLSPLTGCDGCNNIQNETFVNLIDADKLYHCARNTDGGAIGGDKIRASRAAVNVIVNRLLQVSGESVVDVVEQQVHSAAAG